MLTTKTYARLKSMLTRKVLADEFQALLVTPAVPSAKLQRAIVVALANKAAANEIINLLTVGGPVVLSGPAEPNAHRRLIDAICSKVAAAEIVP